VKGYVLVEIRPYPVGADADHGTRIWAIQQANRDLETCDSTIEVRIDRVESVEVEGRERRPEAAARYFGWELKPGGHWQALICEVEPIYEYWEPGPGEQRLLEATREERRGWIG